MTESKARKFYITDTQDAFLDRFLPGQRTAVVKKLIDGLMVRVQHHEANHGPKEWLSVSDVDAMQ